MAEWNVADWNWTTIGAASTVVAAVVAAIALIIAAVQTRSVHEQVKQMRNIALGDFVLRMEQMFQANQASARVHRNLREDTGKWVAKGAGPEDGDEWTDVEMYMGLFERINVIAKLNLVPLAPISMSYKYRMETLVANDVIYVKKLQGRNREYWENFVELANAMGVRRPNGSDV